MILNIQNQSAVQRSYLSGLVTVSANSLLSVPANYLYPITRDSILVYDCQKENVTLNDGVNIYSGQSALNYLNEIASSLGGAVIALIGSAVPNYAITVGGQDPNGNAIIGTFDINANLKTLDYATSALGLTIPSSASFLGGQNPSGNLQGLLVDTSGRLYVDLFDGSGNDIASINSQIETRDVLNVSAQYRAQSVTTTATEALGGSTILSNRKLIHITPTNGIIYWGYNSSVTTTTGTPLFPNNTLWLSVTDNVHVYIITASTADSRIGELS